MKSVHLNMRLSVPSYLRLMEDFPMRCLGFDAFYRLFLGRVIKALSVDFFFSFRIAHPLGFPRFCYQFFFFLFSFCRIRCPPGLVINTTAAHEKKKGKKKKKRHVPLSSISFRFVSLFFYFRFLFFFSLSLFCFFFVFFLVVVAAVAGSFFFSFFYFYGQRFHRPSTAPFPQEEAGGKKKRENGNEKKKKQKQLRGEAKSKWKKKWKKFVGRAADPSTAKLTSPRLQSNQKIRKRMTGSQPNWGRH